MRGARRVFTVYTLHDPLTGAVRYVGVTGMALAVRAGSHCRDAVAGRKGARSEWIRSLLAMGLEPVAVAIAQSRDVYAASDVEQAAIAQHAGGGARLLNDSTRRRTYRVAWRGRLRDRVAHERVCSLCGSGALCDDKRRALFADGENAAVGLC